MATVSAVIPVEYGTFEFQGAVVGVQGSHGPHSPTSLWLVLRLPNEPETSLGALRGLDTEKYTVALSPLQTHLSPYSGDFVREAVRVYEEWKANRT